MRPADEPSAAARRVVAERVLKEPATAEVLVDGQGPLIIIGNEGALRVTAQKPARTWSKVSAVGSSNGRWEERIHLPNYTMTPRGKYISDGGYTDAFDGKRVMFYCRYLPDDAREDLNRLDDEILVAKQTLRRLERERQEFLASAARRGAHVPTPPAPPKPKKAAMR